MIIFRVENRVATTRSHSAVHPDGICLIQVSLFKISISSSKNIILQLHVLRAFCSESNPSTAQDLLAWWRGRSRLCRLQIRTRNCKLTKLCMPVLPPPHASWPTYACPWRAATVHLPKVKKATIEAVKPLTAQDKPNITPPINLAYVWSMLSIVVIAKCMPTPNYTQHVFTAIFLGAPSF